MPATMSSRERMLAALRREGPDHLPFSPYIAQGPWWPEPLFWRDQIERARRMLDLGLDPTIDIWLPDPQPLPEVTIRTWREEKRSQTLIVKEYHTPAGILRQVVRETDDWCDLRHGPWIPTTFGIEKRDHFGLDLFDDYNVSRRLEPWVKGREDLAKLRYIICPPRGHVLDEWRMDAQRAMGLARKYNLLTVARRTIVGDAFQWFCEIPWFMTQIYDDPDFVHEFLGIFQEWSMQLVQSALEVGVDVVQYRGWYETPTFWGPRGWSRYLAPCIEEQACLVRGAGKVHTYLLPEGQGAYAQALRAISTDALQGLDPRQLRGGDLRSLATQLGDKSFWGGVNAEVTLHSEDPALIAGEVREAVEALGEGGGLILSAFLFQEVPLRGILLLIEAWRKYAM